MRRQLILIYLFILISGIAFCQDIQLTLIDSNATYSFLGAYNNAKKIVIYRKAKEDISKGVFFVIKDINSKIEKRIMELPASNYIDWFDSTRLLIHLIKYGNPIEEGLYLLNPFTKEKEILNIPIQEMDIYSSKIYTDNQKVYYGYYDYDKNISVIYEYNHDKKTNKVFLEKNEIISLFSIGRNKDRIAYWSVNNAKIFLKVCSNGECRTIEEHNRISLQSGNLVFKSDENKLYFHYFADSCSTIIEFDLINSNKRLLYRTKKGYEIEHLSLMGENKLLLSIINNNPINSTNEIITHGNIAQGNITIVGEVVNIKLYCLEFK